MTSRFEDGAANQDTQDLAVAKWRRIEGKQRRTQGEAGVQVEYPELASGVLGTFCKSVQASAISGSGFRAEKHRVGPGKSRS
jgi:hypothetical protein